jgi:tripartite-type tricarboxylate transporter receptor subunit TctC
MRQVLAAAAVATFALAVPAKAQNWPERTVTIVVPFTAGGTTDLFGRLIANHMQQKTGKAFVVENKAGAGGNIGATAVARAPADGYTFLVGTVSTHAINPFLYAKMPHDTLKDFQPVSLIARLPNMLVVNPKIPAKDTAELITYLKANPDKLSYGSSGAGTSTHLAAELFKMMTGTKMTHIPYKSSGEVMTALSGGHIDLAFDNMTLAWPQAQAGTIRALAVTSTTRSPTAPNVPTVSEQLAGFDATSWHGVFAPAGTPKAIVDAFAAEIKAMLEKPDIGPKLTEIGAVASPMTPDQFATFINDERKKWEEVVKLSGAKIQ